MSNGLLDPLLLLPDLLPRLVVLGEQLELGVPHVLRVLLSVIHELCPGQLLILPHLAEVASLHLVLLLLVLFHLGDLLLLLLCHANPPLDLGVLHLQLPDPCLQLLQVMPFLLLLYLCFDHKTRSIVRTLH